MKQYKPTICGGVMANCILFSTLSNFPLTVITILSSDQHSHISKWTNVHLRLGFLSLSPLP